MPEVVTFTMYSAAVPVALVLRVTLITNGINVLSVWLIPVVVVFVAAVSCANACCINWLLTSIKNGASNAKNAIPDKIAYFAECLLFIDTKEFTFNLSLSSLFLDRPKYH